jgi:hypothetical protein
MTTTDAISKIQPTLDKYNWFARPTTETEITLINKNRELCGKINLEEPVMVFARFVGQKTMMGSLVRNDLCAVLGNCGSGKY